MFVEGHTRSEVGQFSTADMGQFYSVANIMPVKGSRWNLAAVRTWYNWTFQENIFLEISYPAEPGDLILFDKLIEDKELDHIGIVLEVYQNYIITSEGNYHNCTGIFKRRKDSTMRGFIRL